MGSTPTPHDAVFTYFLSDVETARDFLQIHLPPALLQRCNLDTLQITSGSFIEIAEKLQQDSRQQGKQEVAREMLAKGMDFSVVQEMTGLTADELKQLH